MTLTKKIGQDLPLLFKLHKFGQLILRKIIKIVATRRIFVNGFSCNI